MKMVTLTNSRITIVNEFHLSLFYIDTLVLFFFSFQMTFQNPRELKE